MNSSVLASSILAIVTGVLLVVNLLPINHQYVQKDEHGKSYNVYEETRGLPFAFLSNQGAGNTFVYQALFGDVTVAGVVLLGANVLLDWRTNK